METDAIVAGLGAGFSGEISGLNGDRQEENKGKKAEHVRAALRQHVNMQFSLSAKEADWFGGIAGRMGDDVPLEHMRPGGESSGPEYAAGRDFMLFVTCDGVGTVAVTFVVHLRIN